MSELKNSIKEEFYNDFKNILLQVNGKQIQKNWTYIKDQNCFLSPILVFQQNLTFELNGRLEYYPEQHQIICRFIILFSAYNSTPYKYEVPVRNVVRTTFSHAINAADLFNAPYGEHSTICGYISHLIGQQLNNNIVTALSEVMRQYGTEKELKLYPKENT